MCTNAVVGDRGVNEEEVEEEKRLCFIGNNVSFDVCFPLLVK